MTVTIRTGFELKDRPRVAELFWQAFRGKLGFLLGPRKKAMRFLNRMLDPAFAISAYSTDGDLLGVAGYKTHEGMLVGGDLTDLSACYGPFNALWRGMFLSVLERPTKETELCMDGIFVTADARGQGVGTALLGAVRAEAQARGMATVRLDVIDTNPRALALYESIRFEPRETSQTGLLRAVFGFSSATRMVLNLS